jgi:hypothetical protein
MRLLCDRGLESCYRKLIAFPVDAALEQVA